MRSGNTSIVISAEMISLIEKSTNIRVSKLSRLVDAINAIVGNFPEIYHWRFKTAKAFTEEQKDIVRNGGGALELNSLYWRDMLATIEAYSVTSTWRIIDISQAIFQNLKEDHVIPASILARSAFESAIQFVHDGRTVSRYLEEFMKSDLTSAMVVSEELEKFLLQTVYASRISGSEEIYKSKNILTVLDKIVKWSKDQEIKTNYETLCELTHPNFLGRSIYINDKKEMKREGDEIRLVSHKNGANSDSIIGETLWALSWAIEGHATSVHLIQEDIKQATEKFPSLKKAG